MSGNLCRCGAYPNIVAAIEQAVLHGSARHDAHFDYARASDVADAVRQIAGRSGGEVHRRRHQPRRPDEGERRAARAADRHQRGCRSRPSRRPPDGGLRIGALVPNCGRRLPPADRGRAIRCSRARSSPARRRSCATWRRPAATCCSARAAPTSTTSPRPATSASRAAAARRSAGSTACTRSSARASTASRRIRPTCASRCAALEATVHVTGPAGERAIPFADFHRLPGDTPQIDTNLAPGRDHHGDRSAARRASREHYTLPQDPRPAVLRVRAGVGRGGAGAGRRHDQRGAARARRRRAQAVARSARPKRCSPGRRRAQAQLRAGRRRRCCATRRASAQRLQDRAGAPRDRARARRRLRTERRSRSRTRRSREPAQASQSMAPYIGTATSAASTAAPR